MLLLRASMPSALRASGTPLFKFVVKKGGVVAESVPGRMPAWGRRFLPEPAGMFVNRFND